MKKEINKGQILAEIVIAIGVLALILVGMSDLSSRSTVSIRLNKEKDEAARAVEARLSYFRQERDRDANAFFNTLVHNLDGGFNSCPNIGASSSPWPIAVQYTFSCTESFTSVNSGVSIEVRAEWTNKTLNDTSVTLSTIISEL